MLFPHALLSLGLLQSLMRTNLDDPRDFKHQPLEVAVTARPGGLGAYNRDVHRA
jgi:hypothetical protein